MNSQKIFFITYGNHHFKESLIRIKKEAQNFGVFAEIIAYSPDGLSPEFWEKHKQFIRKNRRGGGFYIWKHQIINQTLEKMNNNDLLVYLDAGCTLNPHGRTRFQQYVKMINQHESGILLFQLRGHLERYWTKADVFDYFKVQDHEEITHTSQLVGGILMIRKCPNALKFVNQYSQACVNHHLINDDRSAIKNSRKFQKHRHDQSIISIVGKLNKCLMIKDETYFHKSWDTKGLRYPFWATRSRK